MGARLRSALLGLVLCAPAAPLAGQGYVPHRVYDARAGRFVDFEAMAAALAASEAVFFGEQHDDPGTHRMEAALLEALARRRGGVVVGMEMLERDVQPLLDRYLAGEVAEEAFLAGARPWPNHASDYRPLLEAARSRGWPVLASNAPRRLASQVSRGGLDTLAALDAGERALVARDLRCPRDAYRERFLEQMAAHPMGGPPEAQAAMAERFYLAQCAKDETMAESVAEALARGPAGTLVVHFNGAFHSDHRLGIVPRVERRRPGARLRVVSAVPVADLDRIDVRAHRARGDYLVFTLAPAR